MCLRRLRPIVPECPHFEEVFPRDLMTYLELAKNGSAGLRARKAKRWATLRAKLLPRQPCSGLANPVDCAVTMTAALKPAARIGRQ